MDQYNKGFLAADKAGGRLRFPEVVAEGIRWMSHSSNKGLSSKSTGTISITFSHPLSVWRIDRPHRLIKSALIHLSATTCFQ